MPHIETATFAGGCFWCTEAIFQRLKGVQSVLPGYSGGHVQHPSYDQVSMGNTGHAEVIQIEFDSSLISYEKLLEVFMYTHNPTTLNQQGNDVGSQYRSAIFYHSEEQRKTAEHIVDKLADSGAFNDPIVTEITQFDEFFPAEHYHRDYYESNREAPYCSVIIAPKIQKLLKEFGNDVKDEYKESHA